MTVAGLVRRGLRLGVRWWWQSARPSTAAALHGRGTARAVHEAGRAPTTSERFRPSTPASGPWAGIDPYATPQWPRRGSLVVLAAWAGAVGLHVRREARRAR